MKLAMGGLSGLVAVGILVTGVLYHDRHNQSGLRAWTRGNGDVETGVITKGNKKILLLPDDNQITLPTYGGAVVEQITVPKPTPIEFSQAKQAVQEAPTNFYTHCK